MNGSTDDPFTLRARNTEASAYQGAGDLTRAITLFEASVEDGERVLGPDHPDMLNSRNDLACARGVAGDLPLAIRLRDRPTGEAGRRSQWNRSTGYRSGLAISGDPRLRDHFVRPRRESTGCPALSRSSSGR
ncbi:tetratricopeptide repeat protein [Amycolatopsis alba]|uniref:tetratricopeptide repeat protein n=1 Tax=Amycolatopsis alba TaxID=76020 RepID=UPI001FD7D8C0|nr:tetratricopeptide repeat protein [Amycolatopsis alba]